MHWPNSNTMLKQRVGKQIDSSKILVPVDVDKVNQEQNLCLRELDDDDDGDDDDDDDGPSLEE